MRYTRQCILFFSLALFLSPSCRENDICSFSEVASSIRGRRKFEEAINIVAELESSLRAIGVSRDRDEYFWSSSRLILRPTLSNIVIAQARPTMRERERERARVCPLGKAFWNPSIWSASRPNHANIMPVCTCVYIPIILHDPNVYVGTIFYFIYALPRISALLATRGWL